MKYSIEKKQFYFDDFQPLPEDVVDVTDDQHREVITQWDKKNFEYVDGSFVFTDKPPVPLTELDYVFAVQRMLDNKAEERNYNGILSLCTYATSKNSKFSAEGQAGVVWRDAAWATCYEVLAEFMAGKRQQPTVDELIAAIPAMVWP